MKYIPEIKICGITNSEDAKFIEKYGVNLIGFIFAESPRKIKLQVAEKISQKIKNVKRAGVFVNENIKSVNYIIKKLKLDFVQLCGEEKINYIKKIKFAHIIKVLRPRNKKELKSEIKKYEKYVDYFLLDTFKKGIYGGTGEKFDLNLIKIIKKSKKPYFVAGGITPENVKELLIKYRPYGIDVNSGIEKSYGKKSKEKIKLLFKNIKEALKFINEKEN